MPSWQSRLIQVFIRAAIKRHLTKGEAMTVRYARDKFGSTGLSKFLTPRGTTVRTVAASGIHGEWVSCAGTRNARQEAVIMYLHGGAYIACSPETHRPFTAELSRSSGIPVFSVDYRLAPEHRFPAAVEDAVAAYRWLLEQGFPPKGIVIGGDSAGGGLTLAALVSLRDSGIPLPAMAFCLSPWTDLTASGESVTSNSLVDPMFYADASRAFASIYLDQADPTNPLASPLFADLSGLPPLMFYVSNTEVLLDDSSRMVVRARSFGVTADIRIADRQPHVWPILVGLMPEARETTHEIGMRIHAALDAATNSSN